MISNGGDDDDSDRKLNCPIVSFFTYRVLFNISGLW